MVETATLRDRVVSGMAWAMATRLGGQLLNWAMTLAVVRFLKPSDYGLMAITLAFVGFLQAMSYVGFADALVQAPKLQEVERRQAFGFIIAINTALMLVVLAGAYPVAALYREPRLVALLQFSSLTFPLLALSSISRAALDRSLSIKLTSRVEMAGNLSNGATVLFLAWQGWGVWSLMIGNILGLAIRSFGIFALSPYLQWPIFRLRGIGRLLHFGGLRTIEHVLWYFSSDIDIFIIGRALGAQSAGVYAVARTISSLPVDKISSVVKPIGFAAFSSVQADREVALSYLSKAMRLLSFFSFPAFFGISAVAPEVVPLVLGKNWVAAVLPVTILSIGMALRPTGMIIPSFLMGIGEVRASLNNTILGLFLFSGAFIIGSHWGIAGFCLGGAIAYLIQFLVIVRSTSIIVKCSPFKLLVPIERPLLCAIVMFFVVSVSRGLLAGQFSGIALLAALISIGVLTYGAMALAFCRDILRETLSLVR